MELLRVVSIDNAKEAKDGRVYKKIGFEEHTENGILSEEPIRYRNVWNEDPSGKPGKLFHQAKVGSLVKGSIHTMETEPYTLPDSDRVLTTYTCVVFSHENPETVAKNNSRIAKNSSNTVSQNEQYNELPLTEEVDEEVEA